jgi:hypothetical protein
MNMTVIKVNLILSLALLFSCKNEKVDTHLFLNFHSGITEADYHKLAKENSEITISGEPGAEYNYILYLKSSKIKTTIHPWFTRGLEQLLVHGQTSKREELMELKSIFLEKYSTPTNTTENTNIKTFVKSSCMNWKDKNKLIRLCIDSLIDSTAIYKDVNIDDLLEQTKTKSDYNINKKVKYERFYIYYFEIYYIDSNLRNLGFNKKTKETL